LLLRKSSKIYIENNQQIERKIILQDQEITPLFDTPHFIKGIRNYRITKNWDGAESKTRPSNLPDINLNQSELTRDTYLPCSC
jgi:hypothetical protein